MPRAPGERGVLLPLPGGLRRGWGGALRSIAAPLSPCPGCGCGNPRCPPPTPPRIPPGLFRARVLCLGAGGGGEKAPNKRPVKVNSK